jgi:transcriptional regulator with XRE-family HTH domain
MTGCSRFVGALKECLRARGMTYRELARALRLSEASVKRMFSRGSFTLARVEEILKLLDLDIQEVARMSRARSDGAAELSEQQEILLASDERLISVFWLLLNGWRFGQILEEFSISRAELTLACAKLERAKIIEWGPRDRIRLRIPNDFQWRDRGPAKKAYGMRAMQEFLKARFAGPLELLRFEIRQLSPESAAVIRRRLERLAAEVKELAEVDSAAVAPRRLGIGVLVACRPWEFSAIIALKRRRPAA